MASIIYYPEDVLGVLRAVYVARDPKVGDEFCRALVAVAVGFHLVDIESIDVTVATAGNMLFGRNLIAASEWEADPPTPRG